MREFRLPDVGEGISEGQLVSWSVAVGDAVTEGQVVAEVATDKVTVDLPSPADGTVTSLHAEPGDVVPVGAVLLVLDGPSAVPEPSRAPDVEGDVAPVLPGQQDDQLSATSPTDGSVTAADPLAEALGRVIAAPSTRRLAAQEGVDLRSVSGSGPGGRILRKDVLVATDQARPASAPTSGVRRLPFLGVRAASYEHMARSARTTARSTTTFEVQADGLLRLIDDLRDEAGVRGAKISPVVIVAACLGTVLTRHERLNATLDEEARELVVHDQVDLGIAVATEGGLVVPVLRDVANRRVLGLAEELSALAQRARDGRLELQELRGGTFTLSSTGGIETATIVSTQPVINLPQVATMWVSRISDRPRVRDGVLEAGPVMTASITFDHRVVDGAEATAFINDLDDVLTAPSRGLA